MTQKIQIDDVIYTANLDYKIALKCNEIAKDETIDDFERIAGVICTVYGPDAVDNIHHYEKLITWYQNYLLCGRKLDKSNQKVDMDYIQDMEYIIASFQSDYGISLDKEEMSWKRFNTLINGLSNSEFGNCCLLNRVRNLRNLDLKEIKDPKEREKLRKAKELVALKKERKEPTKEQIRSAEELLKKLTCRKEVL